MGKAVTRRLLRFLKEQSTKDAQGYQEFWHQFGHFIKEGICSDFDNQPDLGKLLRYDTSVLKSGEPFASLDEILSRMNPTQKNIYYLSAPNRRLAEASPYYELFKKRNVEVIFLYHTLDDFVMSNLKTFEGRALVAAESDSIEESLRDPESEKITESTTKELCDWMKGSLSDVVVSVKVSGRLEGFPALVVDHESASLRRMMKMVNPQDGASNDLPKQKLEINPKHNLIKNLERLRADPTRSETAKRLARVIFDGALIQAGIVDDPRDMLPLYNQVLEELLETKLSESEPKSN
jgi:HSP90 family molecular chaperone